jgi:hypothetical protein
MIALCKMCSDKKGKGVLKLESTLRSEVSSGGFITNIYIYAG